jgi:hypothetical protein
MVNVVDDGSKMLDTLRNICAKHLQPPNIRLSEFDAIFSNKFESEKLL